MTYRCRSIAYGCVFAMASMFGSAVMAAHTTSLTSLATLQRDIVRSARRAHYIDRAARVAHVSFTCSVSVGKRAFALFDLRSLLPGPISPRGYNIVVVADNRNHLMASFEYGNARPLACRGDSLILFGAVSVRSMDSGNVIAFNARGMPIASRSVDAADLWPMTRNEQ